MADSCVVLVTGASRGLGACLAEHFMERGAQVVGCSRSAAEASIGKMAYYQADVSEESQVRSLMSFIQETYGRLDITINNAGIASMNAALLTPGATVQRIMDTNFKGTVLVSRESVKLMQKKRFGRIINLTSVAVPMRLEGEAIYAASKSAVETFTRILAREVAHLGITCNAIGPAPIETDLIRGVPKEKIAELLQHLAIKRLSRVEDVAHVVDFFAHPASACITGQIIYLGGA